MGDKVVGRLEQDFMFADGVVRTVRPMTIKNLKIFIKKIASLDLKSVDMLDESAVDSMMEAASLIMEGTDKDLSKDRERLEEAVDTDIFQKIMTVGMGNKFNDPNE